MELGINVDSLQKLYKLEQEPKLKIINENYKYNTKIVEYTFFVQNELEISKKLNATDLINKYSGSYRFLTIKKHEFVNVCENNKKLINNNKIILLKYKKPYENMEIFIDSFFQHHLNNNNNIIETSGASCILWNFIHIYENFFDDFLYLSNKNIFYIDFSSKNLLYNKNLTKN
jgi:hypothetical protein